MKLLIAIILIGFAKSALYGQSVEQKFFDFFVNEICEQDNIACFYFKGVTENENSPLFCERPTEFNELFEDREYCMDSGLVASFENKESTAIDIGQNDKPKINILSEKKFERKKCNKLYINNSIYWNDMNYIVLFYQCEAETNTYIIIEKDGDFIYAKEHYIY